MVSTLFAKEVDIGQIVAYPNPYSPHTAVSPLRIKRLLNNALVGFEGEVTIIVYNANLSQIYERHYAAPPTSTLNENVSWSGIDLGGNRVASGLYYIRVVESRPDASTGFTFIKVIIR